jgi:hypothetical protein
MIHQSTYIPTKKKKKKKKNISALERRLSRLPNSWIHQNSVTSLDEDEGGVRATLAYCNAALLHVAACSREQTYRLKIDILLSKGR